MAERHPVKLAIVVSHPIQHFIHLYRALAQCEELAVKVFFCAKIGLRAYHDHEMATVIKWTGDMLAGYDSEFLPGAEKIVRSSFSGIDNPGTGAALARFSPDVVMLYGYAQKTQLRALAWCRLHRTPVLMTGDGEDGRPRPTLRAIARGVALSVLFRQVSAFLTVGDQNENMLAAAGAPRALMSRTPFSIDEKTYKTFAAHRDQARKRIRVKHGITADAFVCLFVGKLSKRKRPGDLITACRRLPQGGAQRVVLLYCGDGTERVALEKTAADCSVQAVFAGFVNVDELPAYYCAADTLVHPSEHDPHPLVCSEAACIGLPMILSDRVGAIGPTDIARENENALKFACGDMETLAGCIHRLADDHALHACMAAASHAIYHECDLTAGVAGVLRGVAIALGRVG